MADAKVTALTALTGANSASDDLLPIVDISDTTMAASGTTKSITRAELFIGASVISGTYTPTLSNTTNIAASTAYVCQYMRVGNVVTVSGRVDIDPTAASSADTILGISLPIASDFTSTTQLSGAAACVFPSIPAAVFADATNNRASLEFAATDTSIRIWHFNFTYLIV